VIVVDAGVLVDMLISEGPRADVASATLRADTTWAAPRHLIVETTDAIRKALLSGKVSDAAADAAVAELADLAFTWVEMDVLLPRIWELRHNFTPYDAGYVATAEHLDCPLVTTDGRLATAPGSRCTARLIE